MANRYWVGGGGTWNTTSTTNWSATSGGTGGASVPTSADDVFFDQSATYTVTCAGSLICRNITVSAGTVTFSNGVTPTFSIYGSMSLLAGTVWSATGAISFVGATTGKTVTTNGVTLSGPVSFNFVGGSWSLGSALTTTSSLTVNAGSFSTANYNVTATQISSAGTSTRSISLGSSTVTLSLSASSALNLPINTGITFDAGTSSIVLSGASGGITSAGWTFYNVSFTNAAGSTNAITGVNTFNTLSFAGRTTVGITNVTFSADQTIGTLTLNAGTAAAYRTFLASATLGTQVTLSVGTLTAGAADYAFRDIAITGAAAPLTGTRFLRLKRFLSGRLFLLHGAHRRRGFGRLPAAAHSTLPHFRCRKIRP